MIRVEYCFMKLTNNKKARNLNRSLNDTMSLVAVEFVFVAPLSVCLSSSEKSLTSTKFELATKC